MQRVRFLTSFQNDREGERKNSFATAGLQCPRVKHLRVQRETLHVAGDHGEAVALGGGHEQAVHHRHGLPGQFGVCSDLRPDVKGGGVERQDTPGEALFHLTQPRGELLACGAGRLCAV